METIRSINQATVACIFWILISNIAIANDGASENQHWNFYLQSIDPYSKDSDDSSKSTEHSPSSKQDMKHPLTRSYSQTNDMTAQEISEYNQKHQQSLRELHRQEQKNLFESVSRSINSTKQITDQDAYLVAPSKPSKSSYSARQTSFNWGGKESGYLYIDYEFTFESTNTENAQKMTHAISEMAKAGWEVDLNRSFQRIKGNGTDAKAFTTTQMRFRKQK
ncbi:hypothetical protein [Microbulbifer epialgicus]|uniref:DUF4177 domain-containing protein n=1 Tax=Microbulbifer epialgicus TaxID=393907 RepID=A0ABV4NVB2_9GAMM